MLFTVTGTIAGKKVKRLASAVNSLQAQESVSAEFPEITIDSVLHGSVKAAPGYLLTKGKNVEL